MRINKVTVWNALVSETPKRNGGLMFVRNTRQSLIEKTSRSTVTYWINNGWLEVKGDYLLLTPLGEAHLKKSTEHWLSIRPDAVQLINNVNGLLG